jgi:hypothetical protein
MKHAIVASVITLLVLLPACSTEDAETAFVSSARAAGPGEPSEPLYPPLQADAEDGYVFDYY